MRKPQLSPLKRICRLASKGQAGSTIVESLIGTAIAAIGISGLCVANANCLGIARAHKEMMIADQCIQQRSEQYRSAPWLQVTNASSVQALLAQDPVNNMTMLAGELETITVSAYPPVTPDVKPIVVTRDGSGVTTIVSQPPAGFILRNSTGIKIDFQQSWISAQGQRPRSRTTSTVVALGGLL